jgi:hypothetical protein
MITIDDADNSTFHFELDTGKCQRWRRRDHKPVTNNKSTGEFRIPVSVPGVDIFWCITKSNAHKFHTQESCGIDNA